MLRITVCNESGLARFVVEGKLAGACVNELEKAWRAATADQPGRTILIDLCSVSFIDNSGKQLLKRMHEQGIRFVGAGIMMNCVIEEIEGSASLPH